MLTMIEKLLTVTETAPFARQVKPYTEDDRNAFVDVSTANPGAGDVIPDTGDQRKLCWGRPGVGKRRGLSTFTTTIRCHSTSLIEAKIEWCRIPDRAALGCLGARVTEGNVQGRSNILLFPAMPTIRRQTPTSLRWNSAGPDCHCDQHCQDAPTTT
jgi:hypothetical protein